MKKHDYYRSRNTAKFELEKNQVSRLDIVTDRGRGFVIKAAIADWSKGYDVFGQQDPDSLQGLLTIVKQPGEQHPIIATVQNAAIRNDPYIRWRRSVSAHGMPESVSFDFAVAALQQLLPRPTAASALDLLAGHGIDLN